MYSININKSCVVLFGVLFGMVLPAQGCRVSLFNDTDINILLKDQEVSEIFLVDAGESQVVGNTHRRPTMVIFMQVDRYPHAPYKREYVVKQIACGKDKSRPIDIRLSDIIQGDLDTKLFQRSEFANTHKKLGLSSLSERNGTKDSI